MSGVWRWAVAASQAQVLRSTFVRILCASWFVVVAAQCKVPLGLVPMTLEDWAVMVVALAMPWREVVGVVLLFLGYAVLGLPVLSTGAVGYAVLAGPTAGYLAGFVLMAGFIGMAAQHLAVSGFWGRFGVVMLGNVLLYMAGVGFLGCLVGWEQALVMGLWPFVGAVPVKAALAAAVATRGLH